MTYQWRSGIRTGGVSAEVAAEELERIRTEHDGRLEPPLVVEAARPKAAPLHPCFEWSDKRAAEEYRYIQARNIIRSLRIVHAAALDEPVYVHIRRVDRDPPYYQRAQVAIQNPDEWTLALEGVSNTFKSAGRALHDLELIAHRQDRRDDAALITAANHALVTAQQAIAKLGGGPRNAAIHGRD